MIICRVPKNETRSPQVGYKTFQLFVMEFDEHVDELWPLGFDYLAMQGFNTQKHVPPSRIQDFQLFVRESVNMLMSCGHWVCVEMLWLF